MLPTETLKKCKQTADLWTKTWKTHFGWFDQLCHKIFWLAAPQINACEKWKLLRPFPAWWLHIWGLQRPLKGPSTEYARWVWKRPLATNVSKQKMSGSKSSVENCPKVWKSIEICGSYGQKTKSRKFPISERPSLRPLKVSRRLGNMLYRLFDGK